MAFTKFGEFMRIQRIKNHEVMGNAADFLGVSLPFLSAVENGKKNVPTEWVDKIISHYELTSDETDELLESIENSKTQVKLDLKGTSSNRRTAALQFARSFDDMSEETAEKIIQILEQKNKRRNSE